MNNELTLNLLNIWAERLEKALKYDDPSIKKLYELSQVSSDWKTETHKKENYLVHKKQQLHLSVLQEKQLKGKMGYAKYFYKLSCDPLIGAAGELLESHIFGQFYKTEVVDIFPPLIDCNSFPCPFYLLQNTPHGAPLGFNVNGVYMLDHELNFNLVGTLYNFMSYCIKQILNEVDWFKAFRTKKDIEEFKLDFIDPWAD